MTRYLAKRTAQAVIVVLGVTMLTFMLEQLVPGSITQSVLGPRATPLTIAAFNHQNGLDRSVVVQYGQFLDHLVHGNLGFSWKKNRSVDSIVFAELPRDLILVGLSTVLALLLAVPIGLAQGVRRNSPVDYGVTAISFLLYSMPPYVPGLLAVAVLAVRFQVFPTEAPQGASALDLLAHPAGLVLPVLTLTLVTYAQFSRYVRSSVIDSLGAGLPAHCPGERTAAAAHPAAPPAAQLACPGGDPGRAVHPPDPDRGLDRGVPVQLPGNRAGVQRGHVGRLPGDDRDHRPGRCGDGARQSGRRPWLCRSRPEGEVRPMYLGQLVEIGIGEDIHTRAAHPYTAALLKTIPVPDPTVELAKKGGGIRGELPSPLNPPTSCRFGPAARSRRGSVPNRRRRWCPSARNTGPPATSHCGRSRPPSPDWDTTFDFHRTRFTSDNRCYIIRVA